MEINFSTMIFAIINFVILVIGLKVFLYKPVCAMLDSRKEEVANNLNSAEEAKLEAQKLRDEYAASIQNARNEAQDIINQATKIGEQTKNDIVTEAREEAARLTAKAQDEIAREKTEAINEIRNEIADLAVLAASKVVGKTIDAADHKNMVDNFVKEVGEAK